MSVNVGSIDRFVRLVIGLVLIALPFVAGFTSTLWIVASVIVGLVMLGVAATRICPLYSILGIRTCAA